METKIKKLLKKYNERCDYFKEQHEKAIKEERGISIETTKQAICQIIDFIADLEKLIYKDK